MDEKKKKGNPHDGHRDRVRQRFIRSGLNDFEEHQALELLLFYAVPRRDTNELAHKMLKRFGNLHNLLSADPRTIARACGVSVNTAVLISLVVPLHQKYSVSRMGKRLNLGSSRIAGEYAVSLLQSRRLECFYVICLDAQKRLIHSELISEGTPDETAIYVRHIMEAVLKHETVNVILAHNHPSGLLTASGNDLEATVAIREALGNVNIEVLDHIIVAGDDYLSFAEKRLLGLTY